MPGFDCKSPLLFSSSLFHVRVSQGWATWSHGYLGDVYYTNANTVTLTLPPDTRAFYLYIEGNDFGAATITATANDGTSSGPIAVVGNAGATYYGFYTTGAQCLLTTITVNASPVAGGFAIGEFGISLNPNNDVLSCKNVNVSLDQNCEVTITPEMLLTGGTCPDFKIIELSHYNHPIPNPVDSHYLGKTIIGKVTDTLNGNSCWSYITIEDKLAPEIICRDQDMSCIQFNLNAANPAVIEDCSRYTVTLLDELTTKLDCNPEYIKEVRRTWISTDTYGNISDTCVQVIRVERPDIDLIDFPDQIVDLECSRISRFDANGNPHPSITGIPTLEGYRIWPNIDFICNMYVDYEDQDLGDIGCVHKIMRTWRAREWWCNQEFMVLGIQFIQIRDTEGPIITHRPYDFDATTGHRDCEADVLLPAIDAYDRCQIQSLWRYATGEQWWR
ncbi:MAG: hypothetical protein IPI30_12285 [Saprospiraceae bacterium]|nr:hypothetical protein [Candidatus Vicinibacter affinis]